MAITSHFVSRNKPYAEAAAACSSWQPRQTKFARSPGKLVTGTFRFRLHFEHTTVSRTSAGFAVCVSGPRNP